MENQGQNVQREVLINSNQAGKKKDGALKWVLFGGCGCITLVIIAVVGFFGIIYYFLNNYQKDFDPYFDKYAELILNNDIDGSYELCSDEFKKATNRKEYENFVNTYRDALTAKNRRLVSFRKENNMLALQYNVTTSKGNVYVVSYQLINENGKWYIYGIRVN